ncbi:hypothetical protein A5743_25470 [Mycolicibacterium conceptionense]|nr:hypothetical protein A5743_25470 [Mycolicibacterium conceptionense]
MREAGDTIFEALERIRRRIGVCPDGQTVVMCRVADRLHYSGFEAAESPVRRICEFCTHVRNLDAVDTTLGELRDHLSSLFRRIDLARDSARPAEL